MTKGVNPKTGMSCRFIDRTGMRNGKLVFTKYVGESKHRQSIWEAVCDCGNKTETKSPALTRSCGCIQKEGAADRARARAMTPEAREIQKKKSRARTRAAAKSNPTKVMAKRLSRLHRHALAQINAIKTSPTFEALGYTADEFRCHIERQFIKGMGWHNMADWQIDHIIPISTARTVEDVVFLNQLQNLRPMPARENNAKKNKVETLL